jgi:hypothetical protein
MKTSDKWPTSAQACAILCLVAILAATVWVTWFALSGKWADAAVCVMFMCGAAVGFWWALTTQERNERDGQ